MFSVRAATCRRIRGPRVDPIVGQGAGHAAAGNACDAARQPAAHHRQRRPRLGARQARRQHHADDARADPGAARDRRRPDRQPHPGRLAAQHPDRPAPSHGAAGQHPRLRHQHHHQHAGDGRRRADQRSLLPHHQLERHPQELGRAHRGDPRRRRHQPVGQHGDGRRHQHHHPRTHEDGGVGRRQLRQLQHGQRRGGGQRDRERQPSRSA